MANFENIRNAKQELVLSSLHLAVLFAPLTTPAVSTLEGTTGDLIDLSAYTSAGIIEKSAGVNIGNDDSSNEVDAYGDGDPVRSIISKRVVSFQANFLETNYQTLEKFWGTSLSAVTPSTYGGVVIQAPNIPRSNYYRCILLGQDDYNGLDIFPYWIMPKVKLDKVDNQQLKDDGAMGYNMTFKAYRDSATGFTVANGFCGAGWTHLTARAGFANTATTLSVTNSSTFSGTYAAAAITGTVSSASAADFPLKVLKVTGDNGIDYSGNVTYSLAATLVGKVKVVYTQAGGAQLSIVKGAATGTGNITISYVPAGSTTAIQTTQAVTLS